MEIRILCIGDIVGRPGRHILAENLERIVREHQIDCVIANAENAAGGSGLTTQIYGKLLKYGVNLITMGDHIYRKRDFLETLQNSGCIVRPINLSPQASGREWAVYTTGRGPAVAVVSILGRLHMPVQTDNPFLAIDRVLGRMPAEVKIIAVDVHAEVTSEKIALGWYLNGRVSLVFGTHTHVVTADETVLNKGTAYITDLGMTGPHESVLGRNTERVVKSLVTQMPCPYSIATGDVRLNGVIVTVESSGPEAGRATTIERICLKDETLTETSPYDEDDGKPGYGNNSLA